MENRLYSMRKGFKSARTRKGLKQADVAQAMNVTLKTVMNWEQGVSNPDLDVAMRLAELFDCDLDYLVGRIEEPTHDIKTVHDMTKLSVKAIERICAEKATINGSPVPGPTAISLSHLIEAEGFPEFMLAYQTFMAAASTLKKSVIPEVKPYPVDKDGNVIIDGSVNLGNGAFTVIGSDNVKVRIDQYTRICITQVSEAMTRLCEPDFRESYEMCVKNTKRNGRRDE